MWFSLVSVRLLISAQVVISGSWVRAPNWALPWARSLLKVIMIIKWIIKIKTYRRNMRVALLCYLPSSNSDALGLPRGPWSTEERGGIAKFSRGCPLEASGDVSSVGIEVTSPVPWKDGITWQHRLSYQNSLPMTMWARFPPDSRVRAEEGGIWPRNISVHY